MAPEPGRAQRDRRRAVPGRRLVRRGRATSPSAGPSTPLAIVLLLVGPVALAWRDRWPLVAVAVTMAAVDVYIGLGYPYGPIFVSVVVALFAAVQAGQRRATWLLAAAGLRRLRRGLARSIPRPTTGRGCCTSRSSPAGWSSCWPCRSWCASRRDQARRAGAGGRRRSEQRRVGEQRLRWPRSCTTCWPTTSRSSTCRPSVALHLLDEQPEQARPALANIKEASRDALRELRAALDVLRRGEARAPGARARAWPTSTRSSAGVAGQRPRRAARATTAAAGRCRPRSSWPPTASCRRRSPT